MSRQENIDLKKHGIDTGRLPRHIAIIMDGNGRWARERRRPRIFGHRAGIESVRDIVKACSQIGIKYLTLYTFSRENWRRPKSEVSSLMKMLTELLRKEVDELDERDVRIMAIGRTGDLPGPVQAELARAVERTKDNEGLVLVLALSYGGRDEIVDAARTAAALVEEGKLSSELIDEKTLAGFMYAPGIPDPDLLIRTSGELRVSNFLLWQIAYSEIWVTDLLWPDFKRDELLKALLDYQKRKRRFGGLG